jgi:AcrR family transcriptional regulator
MSGLQQKAGNGAKKRAPYGSSSNLRSLRKADTMRRLMSAGCALFNEFGYEATTIDQIASAAGISRAAFYLHFESKADVIRALTANVSDRLRKHYVKLAQLGPASSVDTVSAWLGELLDTCRSDGSIVLLMQRTLQPDSQLFDEIRFYDEIMTTLGKGFPRFAAAATDEDIRAEAMLFFFELQACIRLICTTDSALDWQLIRRAWARRFLSFVQEDKPA